MPRQTPLRQTPLRRVRSRQAPARRGPPPPTALPEAPHAAPDPGRLPQGSDPGAGQGQRPGAGAAAGAFAALRVQPLAGRGRTHDAPGRGRRVLAQFGLLSGTGLQPALRPGGGQQRPPGPAALPRARAGRMAGQGLRGPGAAGPGATGLSARRSGFSGAGSERRAAPRSGRPGPDRSGHVRSGLLAGGPGPGPGRTRIAAQHCAFPAADAASAGRHQRGGADPGARRPGRSRPLVGLGRRF